MDDKEKAYIKAINFLSYRPRSEKEVRDNLKKKKVTELNIEIAIQRLKNDNFVNDEEFASWYIEQRTTFRPRSKRLIQVELKRKGIDREIIEKLTNDKDVLTPSDLDLAKKIVEAKLKRFKGKSREEVYPKLVRALASKGFDWDTIKEVIDDVFGKEYN